jgi:hypothetical protein
MFVKRTGKITLAENSDVAKKVEKEMLTLVGNLGGEDKKYMMVNIKTILLTKTIEK